MQEQLLTCRHQHCMRTGGSLRQWLCDGHATLGHTDSMVNLTLNISKLPFSKLQPCLCSN